MPRRQQTSKVGLTHRPVAGKLCKPHADEQFDAVPLIEWLVFVYDPAKSVVALQERADEADRQAHSLGSASDINRRREEAKSPEFQHWYSYVREDDKAWHRWRESFARFIRDVGRMPKLGCHLVLRDQAKGFVPGNVRWSYRDYCRLRGTPHRPGVLATRDAVATPQGWR